MAEEKINEIDPMFIEAVRNALAMRPRVTELLEAAAASAPRYATWEGRSAWLKNTDRAMAELRKAVFACKYQSVNINLVEVGKNGRMKFGRIQVDGTILNSIMDIGQGTDLRGVTYNRFTEDMLKIRIEKAGIGEKQANMTPYLEDAYILTVKEDGTKSIYRLDHRDKKLYGRNGKEVPAQMIESIRRCVVKTYNVGDSMSDTTAGDRKKWQFTVLADIIGTEERHYTVREARALLTMSMSELLVVKNAKGDVAKGSTRLTQQMAAMALSCKLLCHAHYFGKFEFADGQGWEANQTAARELNELTNGLYAAPPDVLGGVSKQDRDGGNKGMHDTEDREALVMRILALDPHPIVLTRDQVGEQELLNEVLAFNKMGPWYGRVVIVCETETIAANWQQFVDVISDLNMEKAPVDYGLPMYMRVMEVTHKCHDQAHGAKLSNQTLEKTFHNNREMALKWLLLAVWRFFLEVVGSFSANAKKSVSMADMKDSRSVLSKIAPTAIRRSLRPAFDEVIKGHLKTLGSKLGVGGKISISTHGEYRKGIADPIVDILGKAYGILKVRDGIAEVILPGSEKKTWRYLKEAIMMRFPSIGSRECVKIVFITVDEYLARCREKGISEDIIGNVEKILRNGSEGKIILPASPLLLSALGGADFDGDGYVIYFVAEHSKDFEALKIEDITSIKDLDKVNELLLQAARYFFDHIVPLAVVVPEF